ncbi:MAG: HTTM domain-containing protein [Bdellovibrionales bacterium]|nr:HTTM domain-containing protein [Bdellovibrionales bacterium]
MDFSFSNALLLVERLIALAVLVQAGELLILRNSVSNEGVWSWEVLRREFEIFSKPTQRLLSAVLAYPNFVFLLLVQFGSALVTLFISHPALILLMLVCHVLVCLRWRGVFNGGSDYMTTVVLAALLIAQLFQGNELVEKGCLIYIAIQTISSFFIAGVVKIGRNNWRTGAALRGFLRSSVYQNPAALDKLVNRSQLLIYASWTVIIFELLFPLSLLNQTVCLAFISLALLFHLANVYMFGLNRFLYAWGAAYPALYYCSGFVGT